MSVAEVQTADGVAAHAVNSYRPYPSDIVVPSPLDQVIADAVRFGVRFAFPKAYQQCVRDQATIGDVVPALRRLADALEAGVAA